jgi:hypothetical protein
MVAGMVTPAQCRASRGYLDWTQQRLSAASGLSLSLIKDFESGLRVPHTANQARLKATLEQAGIVFATGGDVGRGRARRLLEDCRADGRADWRRDCRRASCCARRRSPARA